MQATSRPENSWTEVWSPMSKNSQQQEKRHWVIDTPKLGNAEDIEFEETQEKHAKEVGSDRGFCNAVQIAKDPRESVLQGGCKPGRDKCRRALAERNL